MENRSQRDDKVKLTLFVYVDSLTRILTNKRSVVDVVSTSFGSITSREEEVQTLLNRFYDESSVGQYAIEAVDLLFVNSIFYQASNGSIEAFKNRLAAFLLYHKTFFNVPVSNEHIATRLIHEFEVRQKSDKEPTLWFHLRKHHLFVLFGTQKGDYSVKSFEVRKALDVYYYILFNIQTLSPILTDLDQVIISGELLDMDMFYNFFEKNVADKRITTYWEWRGLVGKPPQKLSRYLPEVNI